MKAVRTIADYMRDLRHAATLDDLRRVRRSMPDTDEVTHRQLYAMTVSKCRELIAKRNTRRKIETDLIDVDDQWSCEDTGDGQQLIIGRLTYLDSDAESGDPVGVWYDYTYTLI